jgi:hypothetical protein
MGNILVFPSRPAELAKQNQHGGNTTSESSAREIAISTNAQSQIVKALLLSLTSLEAALTALAKKIRQLPAGDCRERLLRQQASLVLTVYQAQRLLAECEPSGNFDSSDHKALVSTETHNSVHELDETLVRVD